MRVSMTLRKYLGTSSKNIPENSKNMGPLQASSVSSWVDAPPDGPEPEPPVDTKSQVLPFGELTWFDFERLVVRLVRRDSQIDACELYGTEGQDQHGLDILATPLEQDSAKVCYQCKRVKKYSPAQIKGVVDHFLNGKWAGRSRELVLCIAVPLSRTQLRDEIDSQRSRLFEKGIKFTVWDGGDAGLLCERLKEYPELVDDFFGRAWVEKFNGSVPALTLGQRLNGYELSELRKRLFSLYSVIFLQHDPGLRSDENKKKLDYRQRYVVAEVLERNKFDLKSSDSHKVATPVEKATDEGAHTARGVNDLKQVSATYETRKPVFDWLLNQQSCVILGEPGSGKSATLRYLALSLLQPEDSQLGSLKPEYFSKFPAWISFARLSTAIERDPNTSIDDFFKGWLHQHGHDDIFSVFKRAIHSGQVLLLVDGLDEAPNEQAGREALDRTVTFAHGCSAAVICTSRPRGYAALGAPASWTTASLLPLSDQKIEELASKWFAFLELPTNTELKHEGIQNISIVSRARAFFLAINASKKTLDLARSPLLCQSLIQLFRYSHQFPEARVGAYKQIVELLLSKHPAARAQAGGTQLLTSRLDLRPSDLSEILVRLAWSMQSHQPGNPLPKAQCEQVCAAFLEDDTFGLGLTPTKARRLAGDVVEQLVTHYGVLVERAPNELSFLHLSIQEYLAAEHVARRTDDEQLKWLSEVWNVAAWHESLISWFGILGIRGSKVLAKQAAKKLEELGELGAWQRMQSIELRAEIAVTDRDLPVSEARRIIEQAVAEVEKSPFAELRSALTRSITLGALDSPISAECRIAIRQWVPGQSVFKRILLLQSFRQWSPSEELRTTLLRAILDQDRQCRNLAVEAFVKVFPNDAELVLKNLAIHHAQPEIRTAALQGLAANLAWADSASVAALANNQSTNAALWSMVLKIRIHQGNQTEHDLQVVLLLWESDALDFSSRHELIEVLCSGWPGDLELRKRFMQNLKVRNSTWGIELPLLYLLRLYPGDDQVAEVIGCLFERFGKHFMLDPSRIWPALNSGFRSHGHLRPVVREMMKKDREKSASKFWGPDRVPAMVLLGDNEARDELLTAYETADLRSRYWIAKGLFEGWPKDDFVLRKLKEWALGDVAMAAPLANWADSLIDTAEQRQNWLRKLAKETADTREMEAIVALLRNHPDDQTRLITESLLEEPKLWYYHRMSLKGLYANAFPSAPMSMEVFEQAFNELDGPDPGVFSSAFQHDPERSHRFLSAATPAPIDVRQVIAEVLRERAVDYETAVGLTHFMLAEENSAVRTASIVACSHTAREIPNARRQLAALLVVELSAIGHFMGVRNRSALAGLLELEAYEEIASTFGREPERKWIYGLIEQFDVDPFAVGVCVDHWGRLEPFLKKHAVKAELPLDEIVSAGFDSLLDKSRSGTQALHANYQATPGTLINSNYLESFARRHPKSATLRSTLLGLLLQSYGENLTCTVARLLSSNFSSKLDIWPELSERFGSPSEGAHNFPPGVLGYLALGWPDGLVASWLRSLSQGLRAKLPLRDRLLVAILFKDAQEAESAVVEMISEPLLSWQFRVEDSITLRRWAETDESFDVLKRWVVSSDPTLSLTGMSLMRSSGRSLQPYVGSLIDRLNKELCHVEVSPSDGLDAVSGLHVSWPLGVYSILKPTHSITD
jgi:NACHT domain